ncbi:hypothetical protein R1sor_022105 [Riccia sorocarpa]|uniref:Reverse transcriptase zinc-binding domain-containing protein n=1 Tax=Riccia sorocarpa TaxID=122646 RepID=A0ABD3GN65_9MARC
MNFTYKLVARIIATRLKALIPLLVDSQQTGFVAGRNITENVLALKIGQEWADISGQQAVFIKLDFMKAFDRVSEDWLGNTGCEVAQEGQEFTYLGILAGCRMDEKKVAEEILRKVSAKLSHWSTRWLTQPGRIVLLKHVLAAMPTYQILAVGMTEKGMSRFESLCRNFVWGWNSEGNPRLATVAWWKIALRKEDGGLNWVPTTQKVAALQVRHLGHILTDKDCEWIHMAKSMIRQKLSTGANKQERKYWSAQEALLLLKQLKIPRAPLLTRMLKHWFSIRKFLRREGPNQEIPATASIQQLAQIATLYTNEGKEWAPTATRLLAAIKIREAIHLRDSTGRWKSLVTLGFTHRCAWTPLEFQHAGRWDKHRWKQRWQNLWKSNLTPRIKFWFWKIYHRGFLTGNRVARFLADEGSCRGCRSTIETTNHLWWNCPRESHRRSTLIQLVIPQEKFPHIGSILDLLDYCLGEQRNQLAICAVIYSYTIQRWKERCDLIFRNKRSQLPIRVILQNALNEVEAAAFKFVKEKMSTWLANRDAIHRWNDSFSVSPAQSNSAPHVAELFSRNNELRSPSSEQRDEEQAAPPDLSPPTAEAEGIPCPEGSFSHVSTDQVISMDCARRDGRGAKREQAGGGFEPGLERAGELGQAIFFVLGQAASRYAGRCIYGESEEEYCSCVSNAIHRPLGLGFVVRFVSEVQWM